ncbi:MAG TPA: DUF411 domain-containing protein [Rhodothermales bacterium]
MKGFVAALIVPLLYFASSALAQGQDVGSKLPTMTVYKNPSCGCCSKWIEHVEQYGFTVKTYTTKNPDALKDRLDVPANMRSCHVGVIGDYLFEGHVPADLIEKFLAERSNAAGLAVPGMVVGSPGMEGHNPQHYDVVAFTKDGRGSVYASR